jgi:hypothetical protein
MSSPNYRELSSRSFNRKPVNFNSVISNSMVDGSTPRTISLNQRLSKTQQGSRNVKVRKDVMNQTIS